MIRSLFGAEESATRGLLRGLVLALLAAHASGAQTPDTQTLTRVRLTSADPLALAARLEREGFDVLPPDRTGVDVVAGADELAELIALGLDPALVAKGRPLREILAEQERLDGVPSGYPDLAAVYARMAQAATDHPSICQLVDLTSTYGLPPTSQGRHMMAVKISDSVALDEDEPAVLVASCHHAREIVTPLIGLEAIDRLTDDYGVVSAVTTAVNAHEIWIAPVWNPDGYEHVFNSDNFWRKNRRVVPGGVGIDQNRNYPQGWDHSCSGSTSPTSQTYKGPAPASEAETQTLLALATDRRFAKVLDFHSSGRETLWSYNCQTHPFDGFWQGEATLLSNAAAYQGAERRPSADGEHQQWHFARQGAIAYLIETATEFQPSYASGLNEALQVQGAIDWMLARPIPVAGHVTDSCTGSPVAATITLVGVSGVAGETNSSGGAFGRWHAYLPAGMYSLRFEAPGYVTRTLPVNVGTMTATALDVELDPTAGGGSSTYCVAAPNSVGPGASIFFTGSASVAANDFRLHGVGMPANQFSLFIYGQNPTQLPLFEGFLCVGNPFIRLPVMLTDNLGFVQRQLDLANPPVPAGQITGGSTWNFQLFYRDPAFGGTQSNLSHGLEVMFCP